MNLTTRVLLTLIALLVAVGVAFALRPDLDLAVAHAFYDHGGFVGASPLARFVRLVFRVGPFVVLAIYVIPYLQNRFGARAQAWLAAQGPRFALAARGAERVNRWLAPAARWAPNGRAVFFLVASITIGSGLIVNLGMKDHLHRPRPVQTQDFGGQNEFRPWYRFDGGCRKNCGFPSGEASSGFWMVAPALLVPPPWRGAAIGGALAFGATASLLRLAFGGHYLSDVLIGALISLIVVFALRRLLWPRGAP